MPADTAVVPPRCPACGGPQEFLSAYPFITALTMVLLDVGPAERTPDGSGSWVCRSPECLARSARAAARCRALDTIPRRLEDAGLRAPGVPRSTPLAG
jgi:hypothetical protein